MSNAAFFGGSPWQANHATVEIHPKQARREAEICLDKEQKLMVTMVKLSAVVLIPKLRVPHIMGLVDS